MLESGDLIRCVSKYPKDSPNYRHKMFNKYLKIGEIYTVETYYHIGKGEPIVTLEEVGSSVGFFKCLFSGKLPSVILGSEEFVILLMKKNNIENILYTDRDSLIVFTSEQEAKIEAEVMEIGYTFTTEVKPITNVPGFTSRDIEKFFLSNKVVYK